MHNKKYVRIFNFLLMHKTYGEKYIKFYLLSAGLEKGKKYELTYEHV